MHREIRQEQDSDTTLDQDFVAPPPCRIPLRGDEYPSERAPALAENAFFNCVLNRTERDTIGIVRRNQRMKEFEGGRRPTKGCRGTKEKEQQRKTDQSVQINR